MTNRMKHLQRKARWLQGISSPIPGPEDPGGEGGYAFLDWFATREGLAHGLGPQHPFADNKAGEVSELIRDGQYTSSPSPGSIAPSPFLTPAGDLTLSSHPPDEWEDEEWATDDVGDIQPLELPVPKSMEEALGSVETDAAFVAGRLTAPSLAATCGGSQEGQRSPAAFQ